MAHAAARPGADADRLVPSPLSLRWRPRAAPPAYVTPLPPWSGSPDAQPPAPGQQRPQLGPAAGPAALTLRVVDASAPLALPWPEVGHHTSMQLWSRALGDAQPGDVHVALRHAAAKLPWRTQARSPWRLEIRAQRLRQPLEGTVHAGLTRRYADLRAGVALAALDAELPPLLAPRHVATRRLRRSGVVASLQWGRLKHGGLAPLLAAGTATTGVRLHGVGTVWLRRLQRPTLDVRLGLDGVWGLPGRGGRGQATAWGRLVGRAVVGGGSEQPLVRVGGFAPRTASRRGPSHRLHEAVLGHEDLPAYSNRIVSGDVGLLLQAGRHARLGAFVAAGRVQARAGAPVQALAATGTVAQLTLPWRGGPWTVTYQLARRRGAVQGTWLHLIMAGV